MSLSTFRSRFGRRYRTGQQRVVGLVHPAVQPGAHLPEHVRGGRLTGKVVHLVRIEKQVVQLLRRQRPAVAAVSDLGLLIIGGEFTPQVQRWLNTRDITDELR